MFINTETVVYKDHSSFKTYTMKCINDENSRTPLLPGPSDMEQQRFIVFSRTQCGEEQYHCVWTVKRSANILEFQIGAKTVHNVSAATDPDDNICEDKYFDETRWLTQGRLDHSLTVSPCPVSGEFTGLLPDAQGLCAKLSSECQSPDIMYYQVSACEYDEVIEGTFYFLIFEFKNANTAIDYFLTNILLFLSART